MSKRNRDVFIKDDLEGLPDEIPSWEVVEPGTYALRVNKAELGQSRAQKAKIQCVLEVMEVLKGDEDAVGQTIPYSVSLSRQEFPAVQRKVFLRACGVKIDTERGGWSLRDLVDSWFIAEIGIREFDGRDVNDITNSRPYEEGASERGEEEEEEPPRKRPKHKDEEEGEEERPRRKSRREEEEGEEEEGERPRRRSRDEEEEEEPEEALPEEEEEEEEEVDRKPRHRVDSSSKKGARSSKGGSQAKPSTQAGSKSSKDSRGRRAPVR